MAVPETYPLTILINAIDVTSYVPYESLNFDDYARQVSTFRFKVEKQDVVTPERGHTVQIYNDTTLIFNGYIVELKSIKRDNGIAKEYELDCADQKIRLQKAIVAFGEFSGSDADILADLLANAYPDLTDLFNFDIDALIDDMDFNVNDENLLDLLNELADKVGADLSFDTAQNASADITYELIRDGNETTIVNQAFSERAEGNPGFAGALTEDSEASSSDFSFRIVVTLPSSQEITRVTFDGNLAEIQADSQTAQLFVADGSNNQKAYRAVTNGINAGWLSLDSNTHGTAMPFTSAVVKICVADFTTVSKTNIDFRIDNIVIYTTTDTYYLNFDGTTNLNWGEPDAAAYDIDVQNSAEFASDIELFEGDFDDFNSVIVTGGYEDVAIDWNYESDGTQNHFKLETPIKSLAVYTNSGTDVTPSWTALTVGKWGTDTFATKNVLYDPERFWLYFNTNPPYLTKSFRLTGTIQKPIRVLVEDVEDGKPTYTTVIHDDSVTSVDDAVTRGQAELEKRNSIKRLEFSTHHPGLKVGKLMTVNDSARGLSEELIIQHINTTWMGPRATFKVTCGNEGMTGVDTLIANNDKRSRDTATPASLATSLADVYTDDSGNRLTDDSGNLLYATYLLYTDDSFHLLTDDSLNQLYEAA